MLFYRCDKEMSQRGKKFCKPGCENYHPDMAEESGESLIRCVRVNGSFVEMEAIKGNT